MTCWIDGTGLWSESGLRSEKPPRERPPRPLPLLDGPRGGRLVLRGEFIVGFEIAGTEMPITCLVEILIMVLLFGGADSLEDERFMRIQYTLLGKIIRCR